MRQGHLLTLQGIYLALHNSAYELELYYFY